MIGSDIMRATCTSRAAAAHVCRVAGPKPCGGTQCSKPWVQLLGRRVHRALDDAGASTAAVVSPAADAHARDLLSPGSQELLPRLTGAAAHSQRSPRAHARALAHAMCPSGIPSSLQVPQATAMAGLVVQQRPRKATYQCVRASQPVNA